MPTPRVLVVDPSDETHEVLRTALAPRGAEILEARGANDGLKLARSCRPDVIVLDLECESVQDTTVAEGFRDLTPENSASMIILGTARQAQKANWETKVSHGEFVRKPYHYGPLIRKIELLLEKHEQRSPRSAA